RHFKGLDGFFTHLEEHRYKIQFRVMIARYSGKTTCPECEGGRLRKESSYVKINGSTISDLVDLPVNRLRTWFASWKPEDRALEVSGRILQEISSRLEYIEQVGLGYLTLNRLSSTLSGG